MTSWTELPRATFDLETTGIDVRTARIVTASLILVDAEGEVIRQAEWLADPGVEIPEEASKVHGITTEYAKANGKPGQQVAYEVAMALGGLFADGVPVIAFNAAYDFSVMHYELSRYGFPPLTAFPVLDPLVINKQVHKFKKGKRTLEVLAQEYNVELDNAHSSTADAIAAERVLTAMSLEYPDELEQDAVTLHNAQIGWAAEQATDLQAYFDRIGKQADIDGTWPVR